MKTHITYTEDFTKADGEVITLPLEHKAFEYHPESDITIVETEDKIIVGYLVQDELAENPLEDCDGMGDIHHHPRSRYGQRNDDGYYDALALDRYGDPIIDEDKLQQMWADAVNALPPELFMFPDEYEDERWDPHPIYSSSGVPVPYWVKLRTLLADEAIGDWTIISMCRDAWRVLQLPDLLEEILADRIEDAITWNYETDADECFKPGDQDAVLLDLYAHGGCVWSVSGTGMNCRWDTSRAESVWVPDKCLREELEKIKDPQERYSQAVEYAKQAVEAYNAWSCGDCYGVVVQTHAKDGEMTDDDSCWGYIGGDYARDELAAKIKREVERGRPKPAPESGPESAFLI